MQQQLITFNIHSRFYLVPFLSFPREIEQIYIIPHFITTTTKLLKTFTIPIIIEFSIHKKK